MEEYNNTAIKILEAAKNLFAEKGYTAVSTKKIAQEAQINEVTIFRLFESKEKLFEAVLKHFFQRPGLEHIEELKKVSSFKEFLHALGHLVHELFTSNLALIKIEIRERDRIYNKRNLGTFSKVLDLLINHLEREKQISKKEAEIEAFCFMTGVHGMLLNIYIFRPLNDGMKFEECFEVLVSKFE